MPFPFKSRAIFTLPIAVLLCAACGGGDGGKGPEVLPIPQAPAAGTVGDNRLPEILEWARASQGLPAMTVMVVRNGQLAERAAIGRRSADNGAAVTSADKWHLGSISKSMTSTLAALLVEEGVITWDTRPLDVWPELSGTIHADFRNTTLRQLLSHSSGLKRDDQFSDAADNAAGTIVEKRRAWAAHVLKERADVPAGTFQYSNIGYIVAGSMLETRAGASWETLLTTHVFAPLGMTHSGFGAPGTAGQLDQPLGHLSRASGFEPIQVGANDDNVKALGPAGTVHSTLDDMALYLLAHLEGERGSPGLLTTDSFRTLHTPVTTNYAFGWVDEPSQPAFSARALWHNGSNLRWFALMWFVPSRDCAVFIATNGGGDRAAAAVDALNNVMRVRVAASP
jgi:CubicO group peptidase (beta-lactamase class C family)